MDYYVKSCNIEHDYARLFNLLVCDKLKGGLPYNCRDQVRFYEAEGRKSSAELGTLLDIYVPEGAEYAENRNNTEKKRKQF